MVGVQRGYDPLEWVVEKDGADPDLLAKLEGMSVVEERFVFSDRLALVIENGPAAADPAWVNDRSVS